MSPDAHALALVQQEADANARLIASRDELLAALRELREVSAAAMRACAEQPDLWEGFAAELKRLGIKDGVGVRAEQAIARAEGR